MTTVVFSTAEGDIKIELDSSAAPKTVENFLTYVKEGFYDNTIFHRVISGFMIQGGGFDGSMSEKGSKHSPIMNEANTGLKNTTGTIAMARTSDPHSASSQFFINVADNPFLDFQSETPEGWGYCAFGKVTEGMEVVQKFSTVATGSKSGHDDVPSDSITITKATVA